MATRTEILKQYDITDRPELRVHAVKEKDVLWVVAIHGLGDPIKAIPTTRAIELSAKLRGIGEEKLASDIVMAAEKAHRSNVTGP